ncbi:MAG: mucoidy inhibitor MuiA family protein [Proteobacteria bacterium]|nr:mucoidy inhibitor MuiA family protein [Pseudomonadota bacterium]
MEILRTDVESKVSAVTVYQSRAMVTRSATCDLSPGNHLLVFTNLPADLEQDSIQVKGKGDATLGECVFETEYFTEDVDDKKRDLYKKRQRIEDALTELRLNQDSLEKEKAFVEKIISFMTTPSAKAIGSDKSHAPSPPPECDVDSWNKRVDFYHGQNAQADRRKIEAAKKSRDLQGELDKINSELDALGYTHERSRHIIKINIIKHDAGELSLDLSYIIYGPSWRPVYNVRASSDSDTLNVEYDALVNQATGENWDNVQLKLSTARVNVSGILPELYPWRLRFFQPEPMRNISASKKMKAAMDEGMAMPSAAACAPAPEPPEREKEMIYNQADVETGGTSVVFSVASGGTIKGDNSDTRVTIMRKALHAEFSYSTVPKLSEFAFLTAKVKNTTDFPFLPGKVNLFFDGSFVSSSAFSLIMPDQTLDVSLGVDEGIGIEYRFLKRFKKNEGLMNKRISEQVDYQIRITNNRTKKIDITVYDQIPIPEEKEISVKLLSPTLKESKHDIILDDQSKIEWSFTLDPAEKRELPFSFTMEYPADKRLES